MTVRGKNVTLALVDRSIIVGNHLSVVTATSVLMANAVITTTMGHVTANRQTVNFAFL